MKRRTPPQKKRCVQGGRCGLERWNAGQQKRSIPETPSQIIQQPDENASNRTQRGNGRNRGRIDSMTDFGYKWDDGTSPLKTGRVIYHEYHKDPQWATSDPHFSRPEASAQYPQSLALHKRKKSTKIHIGLKWGPWGIPKPGTRSRKKVINIIQHST